MPIVAPLLIYFSALATLCCSIALAAAMLLAAPPSATDGKAAPMPAKLTRAADRPAVPPAPIKAEASPLSLVTPAAASVAASAPPPISAQRKGANQKRTAAPAKKPAVLARSQPHQQALGYAAAPDFAPSAFTPGR